MDKPLPLDSVFLSLQLPFADLRSFLGAQAGRLERPSWPLAEPQKDFIRSSGLVWPRPRGGVKEWAGEEVFGDASHALRFPNHLEEALLGAGTCQGHVSRALRRYHSDGTAARLAIDFKMGLAPVSVTGTSADLVALLRDVLAIPIRVPKAAGPVKLVEAGESLAQHFLHATTDRGLVSPASVESWWFCSGTPSLIVEHHHSYSALHPPNTRLVLVLTTIKLSHTWLQVGRQRCSVWFLAHDGATTQDNELRRLRIHLVRLHTERECLKIVLSHLRNDKLDLASNRERLYAVQQYLNESLRTIQRPTRFGLDQAALFEAAQEALGVAFEGYEASLQLMRRQVAAKVEGYIQRAQNTTTIINNVQGNLMNTNIRLGNVNVTGDFNLVTANNIEGSFNKAAEAPDALKEKLQALTLEVANLVKRLPPDDAETVSKDLNALTTEAVSKKPRKAWYELSAKGILDAAKTVAEMAGPVTTAVKAVLALLAL